MISVMIAILAISALGCASSSSTNIARTIGPNDLSSLAGTWVGTMTVPSGSSTQGTLDITPAGEYVAQAGAFSAAGRAHIKDGNLVLIATTTSAGGGARTGGSASVASLSERRDGALVLSGTGHSETGPFNFAVMRWK